MTGVLWGVKRNTALSSTKKFLGPSLNCSKFDTAFKWRKIDDETIKEALAADSELDEYSEESDEDNGSGYK